jgi:hypothetical protein
MIYSVSLRFIIGSAFFCLEAVLDSILFNENLLNINYSYCSFFS